MPYEILLIHGIELILMAFVLFHDQISTPPSIYKQYRHDYKKIFVRCKTLDKTDGMFYDQELESLINYISENFCADIVEARFPTASGLKSFPVATFQILNDKLIAPLRFLVGA